MGWHGACVAPRCDRLTNAGSDHKRSHTMGEDQIEGTVKQVTGKVKEEWGDVTDDTSTEAEGKLDQAEGKVQETWGDAKDKVEDAVDADR